MWKFLPFYVAICIHCIYEFVDIIVIIIIIIIIIIIHGNISNEAIRSSKQ